MNQSRRRPILAGLLLVFGVAHAQEYTPDVAEFDGSNALSFDPAPQLRLVDGGTIEFWVAPDWTDDPGYDPAIISSIGPEGLSYLVAMLRDRNGIAFAAGNEEDVATFDFTDGRLHHVAINQFEDGIVIMIDGQVVGTSELRSLDLPSAAIEVGSIDGLNNPFKGAIAGLRVWNTAVARETLVEFALQDIFAADHPDLEALMAMSDFANGEILVVESNVEATNE